MKNELDHLMFGVARLEDGVDYIHENLCVSSPYGGEHDGLGTHNALYGLQGKLYFEVLAPNEDSDAQSTFRQNTEQLTKPQLVSYIVRTSNIADFAKKCSEMGVTTIGPTPFSRITPDGYKLEWQLLFFDEPDFDGLMPIIIDWGNTPHPADSLASDLEMKLFQLGAPNADQLAKLFKKLGIPIQVVHTEDKYIMARFKTVRGDVELRGWPRNMALSP